MTVKEIKQKLDELGIEYDNRARKDDLLKLLNNHSGKTAQENKNQKSYIVVYHRFKDLKDNDKVYKKGDEFSHIGKTKDRLAELSSKNNKIGKVLIKEID